MDHGSRTHRKYSASSMSRNIRCTAAVEACASILEIESDAAKTGTRAHETLEHCLRTGLDAREGYEAVHHEVEEANAIGVQVCLDYVREILRSTPGKVDVWLEAPFDVIAGVCGGTSDIVIYSYTLRRLWVIDYKNGWEIVEVSDADWVNEQALTYGLGALSALIHLEVAEVVLTIVQPHPWHIDGPVRSRMLPAAEVLKFRSRIDRMINEAENRPTYRPSKSTCRWCSAKPVCPAIERQTIAALGVGALSEIRANTLAKPETADAGRLASLLAVKPLIDQYFKSIEALATERAKQGVHLPGYKLVQTASRREWYGDEMDIAREIIKIAPNVEEQELFELKLKPLTTVEKLVAERARATAVKRDEKSQRVADANQAMAYLMNKKGSGKLVIAPWDDSRPEVKVADQFGEITLPQIEGPK